MKRNVFFAAFLAVIAIVSMGCSAGEAPSGMSADDAKNAIANMSPQDQIKAIQSSPMPAEEKAKRIADIEAKSGVKATDTGAPKNIGAGG